MTGEGEFVEIQGSAEGSPFSDAGLSEMLEPRAPGHRRNHDEAADGARVVILLGSKNTHKLREVRAILDPLGIRAVIAVDLPEVEEDQATFAGNAAKKARVFASFLRAPTLADDSGLVVPALGGEPGVHSARYAGEHGDDEANLRRVLERIREEGLDRPEAYFQCSLALAVAGPENKVVLEAEGRVHGVIIDEPRGENGFGYDPIFFHPESGCHAGRTRSGREKRPVPPRRGAAGPRQEAPGSHEGAGPGLGACRDVGRPPGKSLLMAPIIRSSHAARSSAELLHHRARRSRQVDAGGPAAASDRRRDRARVPQPAPGQHGPRAGARNHDQGERGPDGAFRPDAEPDRHAGTRGLLV